MERLNNSLLTQAVHDGEIHPVFQPVVNAITGDMTGAEVLARWTRPDGRMVPPDVFIPHAMACGQIIPLTLGLMARVSHLLHGIHRPVCRPLTVGFNVEQACLLSPVFEAACRDFMAASPAGDIRLALEVTEREPVEARTLPALDRLKAAGACIVLDDYGTGYATAAALDRVKPGIVKLDRSLTALAGKGDPQQHLANCLRALNARPGLRVLAEGVQTHAERDWFNGRGVHLMQGWLFARPQDWPTFKAGLSEQIIE